MMSKDEIISLVIQVVKKVITENQTANPDTIHFNTALYGKSGILDSLGLVQLIADIEDEILDKTQTVITIADERAMSMKFSPFRNISSLADYIMVLINEGNA